MLYPRHLFCDTLKATIPSGHDIIFNLLRSSRPDMTGYLTDKFGSKSFMIVKIKLDFLRLEHIYRHRRYTDLFNAPLASLVSLQPIPEELKRLVSVCTRFSTLARGSKRSV